MAETEESEPFLIDERLAKMCIFDALEASEMLCHVISLDNIKDIGAFLNSFCPKTYSKEVTSGQIDLWKTKFAAKNLNFFRYIITEMHKVEKIDYTIAQVLEKFEKISELANTKDNIISHQKLILHEIDEYNKSPHQDPNFPDREDVRNQRSAAPRSSSRPGVQTTHPTTSGRVPVLVVYHRNQEVFTRSANALNIDEFGSLFKEKFGSNIEIVQHDLSRVVNDDELTEIINQKRPTILIYDKTLHELLEKDPIELRNDTQLTDLLSLRKFCSKVFGIYCNSKCTNDRFFAFCDGSFDQYLTQSRDNQANGAGGQYFKFNWLLHRENKNIFKMKPLPTAANIDSFKKGLDEFYTNFANKILI